MNFLMLRQLLLLVLLVLALQTAGHHLLQKFGLNNEVWPLLLNLVTILAVWAVFSIFTRSIKQVIDTLELGVKCFEDNDFSITIQNKIHD